MPLCCVECKPCNGHSCLPGLFKSRRPAQQLRRAFGKMKVGGTRRRRRPGSFSSVRAVFWPLMSMRSEADARNDAAAPSASTDDGSVVSSVGARAPSPSLDSDTPGATASTTAARVLALQARLAEASPQQLDLAPAGANNKVGVGSIGLAAREQAKAIVRHGGAEAGEVEAACRSFERQLMEMVVEERKVMDLTDVEELLRCWEKLRCPAFVHLVARFYGEICIDLFSGLHDADDVSSAESAAAEASSLAV
ncbi:unnamed protein product [Urochloa decumbens]|uniref:OVATE domain-containing protein n=1 Tax=Urochloa decumbens TaxID=240449 RepID=A0ABC9EP94_9POAL